ncbi:hypothetical protein ACFQ3L_03245 [Lacticaseibacillus jixianensis]|uniref:LPXTG cell wall anchor domain-containing protein n=1 Tax=Lacticaseibacillus jixianensis TaxID=2486012 RepID=A0ABW4B712_9LACO|nr:hypothetical protein [Lacticaseibacillus jixianensis]
MSKTLSFKKTLYTSMAAIALLGAGAATTGAAFTGSQTVNAASTTVPDGYGHVDLTVKTTDGKVLTHSSWDNILNTRLKQGFGYYMTGYEFVSVNDPAFTYNTASETLDGIVTKTNTVIVVTVKKASANTNEGTGEDNNGSTIGWSVDTSNVDENGNAKVTVDPDVGGGGDTNTSSQGDQGDQAAPEQGSQTTPDQGSAVGTQPSGNTSKPSDTTGSKDNTSKPSDTTGSKDNSSKPTGSDTAKTPNQGTDDNAPAEVVSPSGADDADTPAAAEDTPNGAQDGSAAAAGKNASGAQNAANGTQGALGKVAPAGTVNTPKSGAENKKTLPPLGEANNSLSTIGMLGLAITALLGIAYKKQRN